MGFFDKKKDNGPDIGETKNITNWGKRVGKIGKDKNTGKWVPLDNDGNPVLSKKGEPIYVADEETARKTARNAAERAARAARGGGIPGQEQKPRPEGQGHKRKSSGNYEPGSILKKKMEQDRLMKEQKKAEREAKRNKRNSD